jgi:hypothetical protein
MACAVTVGMGSAEVVVSAETIFSLASLAENSESHFA